MIVNFQKRIEFINECNCIVDLNELEQAILLDIPKDKLRELLSDGKTINWIASYFECVWSTVKARIYDNPELLEG